MNLLTMNKFHNTAKMLIVGLMIAMCLCSVVMPCFAFLDDEPAALTAAVDAVMGIVTMAAKWVGAIISLWGVFQIIMAMRREDSEAISKQIMTVVVGAVLIAFGFAAPALLETIMVG